LDLARLAAVDAAGVGELVRAYNVTRAAGGILRLVGVPRKVGQMLDLARVSALLARR
jgi:ABC-type transporter Mla MlaB component